MSKIKHMYSCIILNTVPISFDDIYYITSDFVVCLYV